MVSGIPILFLKIITINNFMQEKWKESNVNKPLNAVTTFGKFLNCPKALNPVKYTLGEAMATD